MITTVTQRNMVTIPAEVARRLGIRPGWRLEWEPVAGKDEILGRVIPDRAEFEIRHLHEKMDHLFSRQWERLVQIQEVQLDLRSELGRKG